MKTFHILCGFATGFYLGLIGAFTNIRERYEVLKSFSEKEESKKKGADLEKEHKKGIIQRHVGPALSGLVYSSILNVVDGTSYMGDLADIAPAHYFGHTVGYILRKNFRKWRDDKVINGIRRDPEHALDYILEPKRTQVKNVLDGLEERLASSSESVDSEDVVGELLGVILRGNRLYSKELMEWALSRAVNINKMAVKRRAVARSVREFYEDPDTRVRAAVLGEPKLGPLIVYDLSGKTLDKYIANFPELRVVEREGESIDIHARMAEIRLEGKCKWNDDTRELVGKIIKDCEDKTVILLKTNSEMPEQFSRARAISDTFLNAYIRWRALQQIREAAD